MKPATPLEITEHLHQLFASLPIKGGEDKALVLKGYVIALQGYPEWAIGEVVRKYLRGLVPGASMSFCPKSPELSAAIRKELEHVYEQLRDENRERERKAFVPVNPKRTQAPAKVELPRGVVLAEFATADEGFRLMKREGWPVGTSFVFREGKVYGPPAQQGSV